MTTRIGELDERVVGGETLTAAEEAERQDLRRRYPERAAEADTLDHRYRYALRKDTEIAQKAGMGIQRRVTRRTRSVTGYGIQRRSLAQI